MALKLKCWISPKLVIRGSSGAEEIRQEKIIRCLDPSRGSGQIALSLLLIYDGCMLRWESRGFREEQRRTPGKQDSRVEIKARCIS